MSFGLNVFCWFMAGLLLGFTSNEYSFVSLALIVESAWASLVLVVSGLALTVVSGSSFFLTFFVLCASTAELIVLTISLISLSKRVGLGHGVTF